MALRRYRELQRRLGRAGLLIAVTGLCACGGDELGRRWTTDNPDVSNEPQVHLVYALAADSEDRELDRRGILGGSVASWSRWLFEQTGVRLRLDDFDGELDITFVRMRPDEERFVSRGNRIRDALEVELRELGVVQPGKLYAVFYEGAASHACADAPVPPELMGQVTVVYMNGVIPNVRPCGDNPIAKADEPPGYIELATLHELMHAQGAVPRCAPHWAGSHVGDDPTDLMYAGSAPWRPAVVDVGNDDYWGHGRSDCVDLLRSAFLTPLPADAVLPPGW